MISRRGLLSWLSIRCGKLLERLSTKKKGGLGKEITNRQWNIVDFCEQNDENEIY